MKNMERAIEILRDLNIKCESDGYEIEIDELSKKERIAAVKELFLLADSYEGDGDTDCAYNILYFDEHKILIRSHSDCSYCDPQEPKDEFLNGVFSIQIDEGIDEFSKQMEPVKIINLTPHDINIITESYKPVATFKSEGIARVGTESVQTGEVNGIPVFSTEFGEVIGLPEPQERTVFIVSLITRQACPGRKDLLIPSHLIRDEDGKIIGCVGLE